MIWITGDTHGEQYRILDIEKNGLTSGDTLIVCGDFGYIFRDDYAENFFLDDLNERGYDICFVDGNHENFPAIYSYPKEEWCGGHVHRIRSNIYHLMRGQVFEIDGKSFFTMGGAYSIDKYLRLEGVSWWSEELPTNAEYHTSSKSLEECGWQVDYVLSHTAPTEIVRAMGYAPDPHDAELCGYLEWVMQETQFKKWFFGHWHIDREFYGRIRAVFDDVIRLD